MKALEFLVFGPDLQAVSLKGTRFRLDCLRMVALGLTESTSLLEVDLEDARVEGEAFMARAHAQPEPPPTGCAPPAWESSEALCPLRAGVAWRR